MRITLSGSIAVDHGESGAGPFRLAGRRSRVAFAVLVLERHRPVSRHELADALWPGGLPVSWEPGVRTVLSHVRSALTTAGAPPDALRVAFGNYQLHLPAATVVDVEEAIATVERSVAAGAPAADDLAAAARVLANPFLAGEEGGWVEGVRRHHHVRLLQALDALVQARLLENDVRAALRAAEEAVALEPYREASHVLLMRSHAAAGDRAEALRAYSRCRTLLAEELGVSPSPETEEQYLALPGRESSDEPRGTPASGSQAHLPTPLAGLAERPLVGRQAELAAVEAAGGLVVIRGVLGIGKTHLAAEAARRAHAAGSDVWFGRFDGYLQAAYGPFVDITRSLLRAAAAAGRPVAPGPLTHLAPDLVAPAPWDTTDPEVARALLFDAIGALVNRSVGPAGAVLVLDDLQLAPPTAFALLLHLLTGGAGAGLRVIATCQESSGRPAPELEEMAEVLGRLPGASEVVLGGLATDELDALVRSTGVSEADAPAVVGRLATLSGGNPLYALTVLRDSASAGDSVGGRGLQELMVGHLRALGDPARRVVEAAAVLGDHTTLALLSATCADLPEPIGPATLSACLDEAVAAGVLERVPGERGRLGFVHGVLRRALYAQLPAGRRAQLHLSAGRAMERLSGRGPAQLAELAVHFGEAMALGDCGYALDHVEAAARAAAQALAYESAIEQYRWAIELVDTWCPEDHLRRCDLMLALGRVFDDAGAFADSDAALSSAAALARTFGWADRFARAALDHGGSWTRRRPHDRAHTMALLDEALGMLGGDAVDVRARVAARLHRLADGEGPGPDATEPAVAAGQLEERWWSTTGPGRLLAAEELADLGARHDLPNSRALGLLWSWLARLEAGRATLDDPVAVEIGALVHGSESAYLRWVWETWLAARALAKGELGLARRLVDAAYRHASSSADRLPAASPAFVASMRHAQLSALHVVEGRNEESLAELRSVEPGTDLRHLDRSLALALAHARVGDLDEARPWLEAVVDGEFEQIAGDGSHVATLAMVGRICSVVGDAGRAPLIAARLAPFSGHHEVLGHGAYVGAVDNTLARLALVAGDLDEAAALFEGAEEQHRQVGSPTLEAFSQFGRADTLRRRGRGNDLDEARRLVDHAMATTVRHGAGISLVARAANE